MCCYGRVLPWLQGGGKKQEAEENQENALKAALAEEEEEDVDAKDDGYIELVLRVLARMCDGQHMGLQVGRLSNQ